MGKTGRNGLKVTSELMQPPCQTSDPAAEFIRHQGWLRTVLLSRLGSQEEADDVLQEVALAATHQAARQHSIERVGPWLYRVALKQILLLKRREGRRRRLMHSFAQAVPPTEHCPRTSPPIDWMLSEERGQLLVVAMQRMLERDRQLLMLKYIDGLSYDEIGQTLGVTASSVQSRLHRARLLLRQRLAELSGNDEVTRSPANRPHSPSTHSPTNCSSVEDRNPVSRDPLSMH